MMKYHQDTYPEQQGPSAKSLSGEEWSSDADNEYSTNDLSAVDLAFDNINSLDSNSSQEWLSQACQLEEVTSVGEDYRRSNP